MRTIVLSILLAVCCGCGGSLMQTSEYQRRPAIQSALLKSDQDVMSDEVIQKIFSSKLVLPPRAKVALLRFDDGVDHVSSSRYGGYYFYNEDHQLQQEHMDTITARVGRLARVVEVAPLPSLLVPEHPSVGTLREAAVRLQADLLVVFRVSSDRYQEWVPFGRDKVKAYSTAEMILIDVRTGLIPFTTVLTKEDLILQEKGDIDINETAKRAERTTSTSALGAATDRLAAFLMSVP